MLRPLLFGTYLILCTLFFCFTVIWQGANQPPALALVPVGCALLALCASWQPPANGPRINQLWLSIGLVLPVLIVCGLTLLQLTPLVPHPLYQSLPLPAAWPAVSIVPSNTLSALIVALGYVIFAASVFRFAQQHTYLGTYQPSTWLLGLCATIFAAAAVSALLFYATGNHTLGLVPKVHYLDSLSGTFVNRNSFATFMGLGLVTCLAIMLERVGEISSRLSLQHRLKAVWYLIIQPRWLWLLPACLCLFALILTNSRAGLLASGAGAVVLLLSLAVARRAVRWPLLGLLVLTLLPLFFMFQSLGTHVANRLENLAQDYTVRHTISSATFAAANENPLLGTGLGTFATALALSKPLLLLQQLPNALTRAHNAYAELALELGYPALLLLAVACFTLLAILLHALRTRRRGVIYPALGLAVCTIVGLHALSDFSLSVPAVSLLALTLLALAVARSVQLTPDASSPATTPIKTWPTWLGSILSSGLLLVAAWLSSAELTTHTVQPIIRRAQLSQPVTMRQLATAEQALQRCLRLNPWHAGCAEDLASINLAQARRLGATNPVTRALLFQAQARYQQALSLTPGNARLWLRLAQLNYTLQGPAAAIEPAITSLVVGPAEPQLTFTRVPLLLALYPELNANDQILVRQHLNELWQLLPWQVNGVLQQTPGGRSVYLPRLATLLPNSPEVAHTWQRITQLPFRPASPATRPLGKQPAAR